MGQKKLVRFEELKSFPNVLQFPENMKGHWKMHFQNTNAITLELACGKGEYTVNLARLYPQRNFIGVDLKGNRIWVGAKKALKENITNAAFLRTQIEQIDEYFEKNEVNEIWITFPDPQLRISKAKKRLTHPRFLRLYSDLLLPGGLIHLKTDSPVLYQFTKTVIDLYGCSVIKDLNDVHNEQSVADELKIKTYYESLDIAKSSRIYYLCFSLPAMLPDAQNDNQLKEILKLQEHGAD
jgi:tRNA (guanine-N7-)-methyltransferase